VAEVAKSDREASGTNLLGAVLCVAILLVVIGWLMFTLVQSGRAAAAFSALVPAFAQDWVDDIQAGRLDEAYRATTPGFQARLDRAAFGKWVADHPELSLAPRVRGFTLRRSSGLTVGLQGIRVEDRSRMTYRTAFRPADGPAQVLTLTVVSDGVGPHVDQAVIEPEAPSTP
jgi:hypothetical protein